jgi:hypothetical protein
VIATSRLLQEEEGNNNNGNNVEAEQGEQQPDDQQEKQQEEQENNAYGQQQQEQQQMYYTKYYDERQEQYDARAYYNQNLYGEEYQVQQANESNFVNDILYRIDEDMVQMWNNSPSQWAEEYWEVLAVFGSAVFLVLMCLCYVCCIMPFCGGDGSSPPPGKDGLEYGDPHSGGRVVATPSEMEKRLQSKKRRFLGRNKDSDRMGDDPDGTDYEAPFIRMDDTDRSHSTAGGGPASPTSLGDDVPHTESEYTDGAISPQSVRKKRGSRTSRRYGSSKSERPRRNLWTETVDVWSEFLGFKNTTYNIRQSSRSSSRRADVYHDEDEDVVDNVDETEVEEVDDDEKRISDVKGTSPRKSKSRRKVKSSSSSLSAVSSSKRKALSGGGDDGNGDKEEALLKVDEQDDAVPA